MSLVVEAPRGPPHEEEKFIQVHEYGVGNITPESQRSLTQSTPLGQTPLQRMSDASQEKIVLEGGTLGGVGNHQLDGHTSNEDLHYVPPYSQVTPYESLEPWEIFSMDNPPAVPVYMLRRDDVIVPVIAGRASPPWEVQSNIYDRGYRPSHYPPPAGARPYTPHRDYSPFINQTPRRYSPESPSPYGGRRPPGSLPDLYATRGSTPVSQASFRPGYAGGGATPFASHSSGSLDLLSNSLVPQAGGGGGRHRPGYPRNMSTEMIGIPLDASQTNLHNIRNNVPQSRKRNNQKLGRAELLSNDFTIPGQLPSRRIVTGPARMERGPTRRAPHHHQHQHQPQYAHSNIEAPRSGQQPSRYRSRDKYPPPNRIVSGSFDGSQDRYQATSRPATTIGGRGDQTPNSEYGVHYVNLPAREEPDYYIPFKPQINYRKPSPISPILAARYLRRPQQQPERPREPQWDFQFQSGPELELQSLDEVAPQLDEDDRVDSLRSPPSGIKVVRSESSAKSFKGSTTGKEFRRSLSILSGIVPSLKRTASASSRSSKTSRKSLDLSGTCELRHDASISTKTSGQKSTLRKRLLQDQPLRKSSSRKSLSEEKKIQFYETHTATRMAGPSAGTINEQPFDSSFQTVDLNSPKKKEPMPTSGTFSSLFKRLPWMANKRFSPAKAKTAATPSTLSPTPPPALSGNNTDDTAGRCVGWWVEGGDGSQSPAGFESEGTTPGTLSSQKSSLFAGIKSDLKTMIADRKPGKAIKRISSHLSAELKLVSSKKSFLGRPSFLGKQSNNA